MDNLDEKTVADFGQEWKRFDQIKVQQHENSALFDQYFALFPWNSLPPNAVGFDLGCGSGRWAKHVAPRVGELHCIEPSSAIDVARDALADECNCVFHQEGVAEMTIPDESMDFGYSLGVLHHIPDPEAGLRACVAKLKVGAPFLVYMYYSMDNKPTWYRQIWRLSDQVRGVVSKLPPRSKHAVSDMFAALVYWPMARTAKFMERRGVKSWKAIPLGAYRNRSFYAMRTDALDRFGTRLEHRFSRSEIKDMMQRSGLEGVQMSSDEGPYWCGMGTRAESATA